MESNQSRLKYDPTNAQSIERFALRLLDKSLRDYLGDTALEYRGKGGLGQFVEKHVFGYEPNSDARPDFPIAGVELKTTPMKEGSRTKELTAKERLVLNIINYDEEWKLPFRNSSFWHKNKRILLMFYLHEKEKLPIDYIFKIVYLWQFPIADLKIIKDDWQTIMQKIKDGKAHEITEGDTLYLAACTKGSTKEKSKRRQPFSDEMAQQRAYSLKPRYMNSVIANCLPKMAVFKDGDIDRHYPELTHTRIDPDELNWVLDDWSSRYMSESLEDYKQRSRKTQAIIKDIHDIAPNDTFLNFVERKFKPYYGKEDIAIEAQLGIDHPKAKARYALIAKAILGITEADVEIEEFVKSGIEIKTIRLDENERLKEAMSFKQIQYKTIVNEDWEDSYWYETLTKKFLFVVFQRNAQGNYCLRTAFFWNMPYADLETAHDFWEDTKAKIANGDFDHFIKSSDNMICHVRPKARDSHDLMEAADGSMQKKKCYWLNRDYILKIVQNHLLSQEKDTPQTSNRNVIVGYAGDNNHLRWVQSRHLYNVRSGAARGAAPISADIVNARYLALYDSNGNFEPPIYELSPSGPVAFSKQELIDASYPSTPAHDQYLVFHIEREMAGASLAGKPATALKNYKPGFAPFVSTLDELM